MPDNASNAASNLIPGSVVMDAEGQIAHLVAIDQSGSLQQAILQLPHGRQLRIQAHLLTNYDGMRYLLPFPFTEIQDVLQENGIQKVHDDRGKDAGSNGHS